MKRLGLIREGLEGSPYSVDDSMIEEQIVALLDKSDGFEARCHAVREHIASGLASKLAQANRTSEIYESNRIEGKPATLEETYQILTDRKMFDADRAIASYTLTQAFTDEAKVQDVVGLAAARILVDQFVRDPKHPLTEADLRAMHGLIMNGLPGAGTYKHAPNEISGSTHVPVPPLEVPSQMNSLVSWFRETPIPLLWKSAVAHAWLTHIHPFDDGNGRMARLIANYTLGFGAFPPLIIKSSSDRGRYIDSLEHSDQAGDIIPLARVFVRALARQLTIMEKPDFVWELFQKDLRVREQSLYKRWSQTVDAFMQQVEGQLLLSKVDLTRVGGLSPSDFELLQKRNMSGNSWFAKVSRTGGRDLLLWYGYSSNKLTRYLERDQIFPSVFMSERDPNPKPIRPYLSSVLGKPEFFDELCLIADERRAIIKRGEVMQRVLLPQAAELWAAVITNYIDRLDATDAEQATRGT
ncbi:MULTISPECIES: Fic family protein [unclassified Mycobacterium]|uniref:Fic family protein n=1 Tax=unclassified Mycobacterium TaxID=2642494 RepID=UPI0009941799|nr:MULTISPECIES: Fic family protein [unclassified Mycobacterium]